MIFSTQPQLNCVLIFIFFGIITGLILSILSIIFLKSHQKKLLKLIFLTSFYAFFSVLFVFLLNFFNFGKFSIVLLLAYLCGFKAINFQLDKLVVIFEKSWYNKISKIFNQLFSRLNKRKIKEQKKTNEISSKS